MFKGFSSSCHFLKKEDSENRPHFVLWILLFGVLIWQGRDWGTRPLTIVFKPISLNAKKASLEELQLVPGVGAKRAQSLKRKSSKEQTKVNSSKKATEIRNSSLVLNGF